MVVFLIVIKIFLASLFVAVFNLSIIDLVKNLALTYELSFKTIFYEILVTSSSVAIIYLTVKTLFTEIENFSVFIGYFAISFFTSFGLDTLMLVQIKEPISSIPLILLNFTKFLILFYMVFRFVTSMNAVEDIHYLSFFGQKKIIDRPLFQILTIVIINGILLPLIVYRTRLWAVVFLLPIMVYLISRFVKKIRKVKLWYDVNSG